MNSMFTHPLSIQVTQRQCAEKGGKSGLVSSRECRPGVRSRSTHPMRTPRSPEGRANLRGAVWALG